MSIQIYKPNSKNTGSAFTFSKSLDKKTGNVSQISKNEN